MLITQLKVPLLGRGKINLAIGSAFVYLSFFFNKKIERKRETCQKVERKPDYETMSMNELGFLTDSGCKQNQHNQTVNRSTTPQIMRLETTIWLLVFIISQA